MDQATLDLLPEAVVVVDGAERVVLVNTRASRSLGVDATAFGQPLVEVLEVRTPDGQPCAALVPAGTTTGADGRLSERVVAAHASGRRRPWAMAGARHDDGWLLTFRSAARREAAVHAQADVVATVSHEIRSPLTSVKGFTRTLLRRWDDLPDALKREMLGAIDADADRVTRLLTELLDVARIDTGRVQLHRRLVDVPAVLDHVVQGVRNRDAEREVTVRLATDELSAWADADKLTQMLLNLVDNALRHAPGSPVHVAASRTGDTTTITVTDTGAGVDPEDRERIFTKFGRGRGSHRAGTGLGLYVTRGLARAHGGDVTVEQAETGGARFTLTLPATSGLEADLAAAAERASGMG